MRGVPAVFLERIQRSKSARRILWILPLQRKRHGRYNRRKGEGGTKKIGRAFFAGLGAAAACFVLATLAAETLFNGLSLGEGLCCGIGMFLAFEMAFCTVWIVRKINEVKG